MEEMMSEINYTNTESVSFFINGPGDNCKTFMYKVLIQVLSVRADCMSLVAWSGIAAILFGSSVSSSW
jgi:hypothetical protein